MQIGREIGLDKTDRQEQLSSHRGNKRRQNGGQQQQHGVNTVRRTEIPKAGPLVPETSAFKVEIVVQKLNGMG